MQNVRLWYKKEGRAKYQSHLDLVRCFSRTLRRAEIPIWYTEGFNPRPYLTFSLPLSLGQEGLHEPVDIRIIEDMPYDEIVERMNRMFPEGITILEATEPKMDHKEIVWAEFGANLEFLTEEEAEHFTSVAKEKIESGEILAEKKNKKGVVRTINLCEMIDTFEIKRDGKNSDIKMIIAAGPVKNLNSELLIDTLEKAAECKDYIRNMVRIRLLGNEKQEFC